MTGLCDHIMYNKGERVHWVTSYVTYVMDGIVNSIVQDEKSGTLSNALKNHWLALFCSTEIS